MLLLHLVRPVGADDGCLTLACEVFQLYGHGQRGMTLSMTARGNGAGRPAFAGNYVSSDVHDRADYSSDKGYSQPLGHSALAKIYRQKTSRPSLTVFATSPYGVDSRRREAIAFETVQSLIIRLESVRDLSYG